MALQAYRLVLRAARIAFQGAINEHRDRSTELTPHTLPGDTRILSAARLEARSKFDSNRNLAPQDSVAEQKIAEAIEVARILRQNIVQGKPAVGEKDRYGE